jgi:hypothetical protein
LIGNELKQAPDEYSILLQGVGLLSEYQACKTPGGIGVNVDFDPPIRHPVPLYRGLAVQPKRLPVIEGEGSQCLSGFAPPKYTILPQYPISRRIA